MATAKAYGNGAGRYSWLDDTIKCLLTTSAYVPDQDAHVFKSSVTNEITGTQYTAGGVTLANKAINYVAASNQNQLDADDPTWGSTGSPATITARIAVFYKDTGAAATSPLIAWMDFTADESVTGGIFRVQLDPTGVITASAA